MNARINLVRQIPEEYGTASHRGVYAAESRALGALRLTEDFILVTVADIEQATLAAPTTVGVWRLLLGCVWREFSAATRWSARSSVSRR